MKIDELRAMNSEELGQAAINASEDLFRLRFQHHTGQLTVTSSLTETRRTIARIKTLQAEMAKEGGDE